MCSIADGLAVYRSINMRKKEKTYSGASKSAPKQEEILNFLYMLPEAADGD